VVFVVQLAGIVALALVAFVDVHDRVADLPSSILLGLEVILQEGSIGAEHVAVVPVPGTLGNPPHVPAVPVVPAQVHDHDPVPETVLAFPELHKFAVGLVGAGTPFAEPQLPFTPGVPLTAGFAVEHGALLPLQ